MDEKEKDKELEKSPPPDFQELAREVGEFIREKFGGNPVITLAAPARPRPAPGAEKPGADADFRLDFNYTPKQVKEYLDRFVIRQEEAKKVLAVAVCDHYNHSTADLGREVDYDYTKQNVIMLGPTGVGKTYLVKCVARLIGVPFVKSDATKYSETGYVGRNVEDMVRELVRKADGNIRLAEYGIIYIDEVDKIAGAVNVSGRDVSGAGVQRNLLKLMEETEVPLRDPQDATAQIEAMLEYQQTGKINSQVINTRNILFIVSGAFDELSELVRKRLTSQALGFGAAAESKRRQDHYLSLAITGDFIKYGLEPEFIGRLPVRVSLEGLGEDDLFQILTRSEGSVIRQYRGAFAAFGIAVDFTQDGLKEIARLAAAENTGARGLLTVCERVLRDFKYELPSTTVSAFRADARLIRNPARALRRLLAENRAAGPAPELAEFVRAFAAEHGIRLAFTASAAKLAAETAAREGKTLSGFCRERLKELPYGLLLAGIKEYRLTQAALRNPRRALTGLVKTGKSRKPRPGT